MRRVPGLVLLLGSAVSGVAMTPPAPVLLELFTSEGCSSCPPADALLARLDGQVVGGRRVIVLSEHVTYWNRLGWVDPFSSEEWTARQAAYSRRLGLEDVYTPQMVVGGTRQLVGGDRAGTVAAIGGVGAAGAVTLSEVKGSRDAVTAKVQYAGNVPAAGAEMWAVLADDADETSVPRGENAGRVLRHVAVARVMVRVGAVAPGVAQEVRVPLPAGLRDGRPRRLVVWVQEMGLGKVLGVEAGEVR